jgi:hypothetical protein
MKNRILLIFTFLLFIMQLFPADKYWEIKITNNRYSGQIDIMTDSSLSKYKINGKSSFSDAIVSLGQKKTTIVIKGIISTGYIVIPSNITLEFVNNGQLKDSVKINGEIIAPLKKIFNAGVDISNSTIKVVYPEWWGAVADDSTDNSQSIGSALCSSINKTIAFTGSTYLITKKQTLNLNSGSINLISNNNSKLYFTDTVAGHDRNHDLSLLYFINGIVTMDGLTLQEIADTCDPLQNRLSLVLFNHCYNVTINNCSFTNSVYPALWFLFDNDSNAVIQNCKFIDNHFHAIELRGVRNFIIDGCLFQNWGKICNATDAIQIQDSTRNVTIKNNVFECVSSNAFAIEATSALYYAEITDNIFTGNYIGISGCLFNSDISNNLLTGSNQGNWTSGMELWGTDDNIHNNILSNGTIAITSGSLCTNVKNININDNVITNTVPGGQGILVGAGVPNTAQSNINIQNNNIIVTQQSSKAIDLGVYGLSHPFCSLEIITVSGNNLSGNNLFLATALKLKVDTAKNISISHNYAAGYLYGFYIDSTKYSAQINIDTNDFSSITNPVENIYKNNSIIFNGNIFQKTPGIDSIQSLQNDSLITKIEGSNYNGNGIYTALDSLLPYQDTINCLASNNFIKLLHKNDTISITNLSEEQSFTIAICNDSTYTCAFRELNGIPIIWSNKLQPVQTPGSYIKTAKDIYSFIKIGTNIYATVKQNR